MECPSPGQNFDSVLSYSSGMPGCDIDSTSTSRGPACIDPRQLFATSLISNNTSGYSYTGSICTRQITPESPFCISGNDQALSTNIPLLDSTTDEQNEGIANLQVVEVALAEADEEQCTPPQYYIEDVPETVVIRCRRVIDISDEGEYTVCNQPISARVSPNRYKNALVHTVKDHISQVHCSGLWRDELTTCDWI
ncbi:hypothetical protein BKA70DRAFT_1447710 [Coprinopsis sp. MPI-PUGE-AT-0042]|nr:hypothetical protein BKA70DRAFT_1447710 [Coprinopsis sp. MPI-PUGE-AT-0042]